MEELLQNSFLTEKARDLSRQAESVDSFIDLLLRWEFHSDASYAIAYRMPARLAVWWGCVSVDIVAHHFPRTFQKHPEALAMTAAWVVEPSEANRLAVRAAGRSIAYSNPHGPLTKAAGWGLDDGTDVYHGPDLRASHRAIGYAIKSCGGKLLLPMLLALGLEMMNGGYSWRRETEGDRHG